MRERQERIKTEKEKLDFQLKMKELDLQDKIKPKTLPAKLLMQQNTFDLFLHFKEKRLTNISYILRRWLKTLKGQKSTGLCFCRAL